MKSLDALKFHAGNLLALSPLVNRGWIDVVDLGDYSGFHKTIIRIRVFLDLSAIGSRHGGGALRSPRASVATRSAWTAWPRRPSPCAVNRLFPGHIPEGRKVTPVTTSREFVRVPC